jgi:hypothetical protein
MRRLIASLMVGLMIVVGIIGFWTPGYASDWDKAGKILTAFEGIRVLSGGNVDIIGSITGINKNNRYARTEKHDYTCTKKHNRCEVSKPKCCSCDVWVPHMVWKRKYVPEHKEYSKEHGTIIVEAHYIRYRVEQGGHWVSNCDHHSDYHHYRK